MNDVVVKEEGLISVEDIEYIRKVDETMKRYKVWVDAHKELFEKFLDEKGLDSYTQDGVSIYKTKPYKKKQVDISALKSQGLYDEFVKDVWVKGSVRIQVNYDD